MDEDSSNIQTPQPPEIPGPVGAGSGGQMGEKLKAAAGTAKDIIGAASGGAGDGIGGGVSNIAKSAMGAMGGSGGGKALDGVKPGTGNNKTPGMFKGMEGDSKPSTKNDISSDSKNPGAADFAKKVGAHAAGSNSAVQKTQQAVNDVKEGVKDAKDISRLVASGATDATAWADLAKRALKDPKAFIKRYGRYAVYAFGFMAMQFMIIFAIVGVIFFGIYKVYLAGKSVWENPLDIANTIRVSTEMGSYFAKFATQLAYERSLEEGTKPGVALAADTSRKNYDLSALKVNPETEKMFTAWNNAGLAEKFLDDYHAEVKPNGTARQVDTYDPGAWDLYVNSKYIGPLNSTRSRAFISTFAEDTTHWKDIYTRKTLQDSAKSKFEAESFKLDLPDSNGNIETSRKNITQKVVKDTLNPVAKNSGNYYDCLIGGSTPCDSLGLGSKDSPSNDPGGGGGGIFAFISNLINSLKEERRSKVTKEQLTAFAGSKSEEIDGKMATYENKGALAANISTTASDAVLSGVDKSKETGQPDSEVLLQMYGQFQNATDNQNFSRVNYDRTSRQSVAQGLTYFTAGGQLLNNDMSLLDSWALTENLSIIEESSIAQQAVFGNPIGAYAQDGSSPRTCQKIYNDGDPVKKIDESNPDRPTKESSCFTSGLLPDINEFKNEKKLNTIYQKLDGESDSFKSSSIFSRLFGNFNEKLAKLQQNKSRTSPVSANSINLDDSLAPDLDAYTNQVYGVAKTGAEINGSAYDTLKMAAESLWSSSQMSGSFSTGGSYQDDASVAASMRYAQKFKQAQYAFKPFKERLFSLKTPDSLTGKLALLTPTNSRDATTKTLALFKPSNLSSAVASRLTPTTFAQSVSNVNPSGAVRIGQSASDPNNTKGSMQLWEDNNCATGGPEQTTAQPDGIPFTVPTTSNPCKQATILATVSTCYFDSEDSCGSGTGGGNSDGATPGEIAADTSNVPCYAGTNSVGIRDDAYTKGNRIKINLCEIPNIPCGNQECVELGNRHALSSSIASEAWFKLATKAGELGIPLSATSSWRSMAHQQSLCNGNTLCRGGTYSAVAKPGTSNHQAGVAMDIAEAGAGNGAASGRTCTKPQTVNTATYQFLEQYARALGIKHYANESWHWGTAESC